MTAAIKRWAEDRTVALGLRTLRLILVVMLAVILAFPLFIVVYPHVPVMMLSVGRGYRVDHVLTFTLITAAFFVLIHRMRSLVIPGLAMGLLVLLVTTLMGRYAFKDLMADYQGMLARLRHNTVQAPLALNRLKPFQDAEMLLARIDHTDPRLRSFAVRAATAHFTKADVEKDEFTLVQCFSIFKVINGNWTYVADPKGGEYFARASESAALLAGDCDDHAILMAACIKAIGGEARLIRTAGHIYPELRIGDEKAMERAAYLIRKVLFPSEVGRSPLFYHTDGKGDRWINLDYTRTYPGGEVMDERIIGILPV